MKIYELDLTYDGFIVIVGSNGDKNPDRVMISSIEAYDPNAKAEDSV